MWTSLRPEVKTSWSHQPLWWLVVQSRLTRKVSTVELKLSLICDQREISRHFKGGSVWETHRHILLGMRKKKMVFFFTFLSAASFVARICSLFRLAFFVFMWSSFQWGKWNHPPFPVVSGWTDIGTPAQNQRWSLPKDCLPLWVVWIYKRNDRNETRLIYFRFQFFFPSWYVHPCWKWLSGK